MLNDSSCDPGCNTTACSYDSSDCLKDCSAGCHPEFINDGRCDTLCNNVHCNYDGDDCNKSSKDSSSSGSSERTGIIAGVVVPVGLLVLSSP
jgi:hypothetical protein